MNITVQNCLLQAVSTVQSTDWNTSIKSAQPPSLLITFESLAAIWYVDLTAMRIMWPLQKLQSNGQSDISHCPMVIRCNIGLQLFTIRSTLDVHIEATGSIRHPIPFACSLLTLFSTYHTSTFIFVVNSLLSAMFLTWQFGYQFLVWNLASSFF